MLWNIDGTYYSGFIEAKSFQTTAGNWDQRSFISRLCWTSPIRNPLGLWLCDSEPFTHIPRNLGFSPGWLESAGIKQFSSLRKYFRNDQSHSQWSGPPWLSITLNWLDGQERACKGPWSLLVLGRVWYQKIFPDHTPSHFHILNGGRSRVSLARASESPLMGYETSVKHNILLRT